MEAQERIAVRELIRLGAIPPGIPTKEQLSSCLLHLCEKCIEGESQSEAETAALRQRFCEDANARFEASCEVVDLLLTAKADPNNSAGTPPIWAVVHEARKFGPRPFPDNSSRIHIIIKKLLDAGANVDCQHTKASHPTWSGQTALMRAAELGYPDTVRFLVNNGANVNMEENFSGRTPLAQCELRCRSANSRRQIFWILLRAGAGLKGYWLSKVLRNWFWFIGKQ